MLTLALFTLTVNSASAVSQKFLTTGTFTPPAGITSITVECWGGGGAGGSAQKPTGAAGNAGAGGGGGGAYAKKINIPVTPGTPYTVTIPAAAVAPTSGFINTQQCPSGANVTFTGDAGVSVTANGGAGAQCAVSGASAVTSAGGAGGAISGLFDVEWAGGVGGSYSSANGGPGGSGASDQQNGKSRPSGTTLSGGTTPGSDTDHNGGAGGPGKTGAGAGNAGAAQPGGAGGGAKCSTANTIFAGASGTQGQVIISYSGGTVVKANNTTNLNLGTSWVGGSALGSSDNAKWDNTVTSANTTVLGTDMAWGSIVIADPAGLVTIDAGNTLQNNGNIDMSAATADLTLNCGYVLGNGAVWNVASGRTLTVNGAISGASGKNLTMQGDGMVILSGSNTYSGVTALLADSTGLTLKLGTNNVIPDGTNAADVSIGSGCTLDLNGKSETINGLLGTSSGSLVSSVDNTAAGTTSTLTVGGVQTLPTEIFAGILQNTGAGSTLNFVKTGTNQITLQKANTLTGTVTVNGGTLAVQNATPFDNISGLSVGGSTFMCIGSATLPAPVTLTGNATFNAGGNGVGTLTLDGPIGGAGDIKILSASNTVGDAPLVILGAASNFTGNVTIDSNPLSTLNSMTVRLGVANALPTNTVVTLDGQNSSGVHFCDLDLNGNDQTLAGLTTITRNGRLQRVYSASTATLTVNNSADYTFGGNLGKTGGDEFGLTKSGKGKFTLSGVNTYTGATIVSDGMLAMGANNIMSSTAVSIGNATLDAATFANTVGTLGVTSTAKINLGTGAALAFADSSGEVWTGGTLDLTGTFVSGASLRFGDGSGTGLTSTQLALITANGFSSFAVDASGFLTATSMGGYSSWNTANGSSQAIGLDHDNDGVSNGVEYFLGGSANTTGYTTLPGVANTAGTLSITWTKAASYTGTYGTDFVVETSSTLSGAWTVETLGVNVTLTGDNVKYTFPAGAKNFARLKVTGP